jgi:endonuclease I
VNDTLRPGGRSARRSALRLLGLLWIAVPSVALAQAPPGYYDTADPTDATTLRATLHEIIDDHQRFPYTSSSTDTWDILELAQEDPSNPNNIIDIYRNRSIPKQGGGNSFYDREHSWPKSYGFPNDGAGNYPYTDCFQLFLCDSGYNSSRSNKPFRNCSAGCTEKPTDLTNGAGGGSGSYPGNSDWTSGSFTTGTWEVWSGRRGDIARAMFYLDVRYEGGTHGGTGYPEPDLILTDNESLIDASNTGNNEPVAYMGMLSVLLEWNAQDPVDAFEMHRNDVVFSFQGNRNPFVDHPEWVDCVFGGACASASTSFCDDGDGSLASCPCANPGNPGSGCDLPQGTGGVELTVVLQETAPQNRATVQGTGFPVASLPAVVVIRGTGLDPAAPVVFGDGLRCVSTPLVRLGADIAIGGLSRNSFGHGAAAGGGTFYYQLWFRSQPATFCTPDAFNLSNGRTLDW